MYEILIGEYENKKRFKVSHFLHNVEYFSLEFRKLGGFRIFGDVKIVAEHDENQDYQETANESKIPVLTFKNGNLENVYLPKGRCFSQFHTYQVDEHDQFLVWYEQNKKKFVKEEKSSSYLENSDDGGLGGVGYGAEE